MNDIVFVDLRKSRDTVRRHIRCWRNREDIRRYSIHRHIISPEEHACWLSRIDAYPEETFWVVHYGDTPIGAAYLHHFDKEAGETEWGFYIADPSARGQGLAGRIIDRVMRIAFEEKKVARVRARVDADNEVARHLYDNAGFRKISETHLKDGRTFYILELDRESWRHTRETPER